LQCVVLADGCPKSLQSDRAAELIHGAVRKLTKIAAIDPELGRASREAKITGGNKTYAPRRHRGWPEMLMWVESASNSSPYPLTGMTPYRRQTEQDHLPLKAWHETRGQQRVDGANKRMAKAVQYAELAHADAAAGELVAEKPPHSIEPEDSVYMLHEKTWGR
jgi:hypothetical protein